MSRDPFLPKGSMELVGAMVLFSLVVVTTAQLMPDTGPRAATVPEDAHTVLDLTFADRADGAIVVRTPTDEVVLPPDTNGFVRGAVRALARERRVHEMGAEIPFTLVRERSGRLTLTDRETGSLIDLRAFGEDNALAFAALLAKLAPDAARQDHATGQPHKPREAS